MRQFLVTLHVLGATVWTGGHLVLALRVLPAALRNRDPGPLREFEARYEPVGMPALLLQVVTGFGLAHLVLPNPAQWVSFAPGLPRQVGIKLALLILTMGLALDARLRVIPRLSDRTLGDLAAHVIAVTVLAVLLVIVGVGIRFGGVL
jgi:putative copper export protein